MMVDPGSTEEVAQGETVNVNGQNFNGPITVFRKNRIREFTICSTGADRNTSIKAFSGKPSQQPKQEDTDVTELEQAKAALQQAETERDNALNELKQFKANKRNDDISALEKELKTQFSAEDKTAYTAMDDASFSFTAKQLRQFSGKNTPANNVTSNLFTHQAKADGSNEKQTFGAGSLVDQAKKRK